jgi:hypothetical protein
MAQRQFSHHLGQCNAYLAELWGVFGLKLAYDRGFKKTALHIRRLLAMD